MLLFETIQILNGKAQRLSYHNERLNTSRNELMCAVSDIYLQDHLEIPEDFSKGLVKCRINYGMEVGKISFEKYQAKVFSSFILQETSILYNHKYSNRSAFNELRKNIDKNTCLILIKDALLTDTTFCNLIFKDKKGQWFTPIKALLYGTQREFLLDEGIINEKEIGVKDLKEYTHFMLINAMLQFDEVRSLPINLISI